MESRPVGNAPPWPLLNPCLLVPAKGSYPDLTSWSAGTESQTNHILLKLLMIMKFYHSNKNLTRAQASFRKKVIPKVTYMCSCKKLNPQKQRVEGLPEAGRGKVQIDNFS